MKIIWSKYENILRISRQEIFAKAEWNNEKWYLTFDEHIFIKGIIDENDVLLRIKISGKEGYDIELPIELPYEEFDKKSKKYHDFENTFGILYFYIARNGERTPLLDEYYAKKIIRHTETVISRGPGFPLYKII